MLKQHDILRKFVLGVKMELSNSLIVIGEAGTGKTETILNSLKELKLKEDEHYKFINNYSSPLELYNIVKSVNDLKSPKILVIDDGEEILNSSRSVGILRSALWSTPDGKRKVCWHSTSPKIESQVFEFTGRIIFLVNKLNLKNSLIKALVSRGLFYHIELSNKELIELIRERSKEKYKDLTFGQRKSIVNYIEKISKHSDKLTLRTLTQAYNLFILSPNHWQELLSKTLK